MIRLELYSNDVRIASTTTKMFCIAFQLAVHRMKFCKEPTRAEMTAHAKRDWKVQWNIHISEQSPE